MNILINHHHRHQLHEMLCEFIPLDYEKYQCQKCGIIMQSIDGYPPVFVCSSPVHDYKTDSETSFIGKLKNFAKATVGHISSGMKLCDESKVIERHNICRSCEFFKNDVCSQCGCPLYRTKTFVSKLSWADQECPVGKWGKDTT